MVHSGKSVSFQLDAQEFYFPSDVHFIFKKYINESKNFNNFNRFDWKPYPYQPHNIHPFDLGRYLEQ